MGVITPNLVIRSEILQQVSSAESRIEKTLFRIGAADAPPQFRRKSVPGKRGIGTCASPHTSSLRRGRIPGDPVKKTSPHLFSKKLWRFVERMRPIPVK